MSISLRLRHLLRRSQSIGSAYDPKGGPVVPLQFAYCRTQDSRSAIPSTIPSETFHGISIAGCTPLSILTCFHTPIGSLILPCFFGSPLVVPATFAGSCKPQPIFATSWTRNLEGFSPIPKSCKPRGFYTVLFRVVYCNALP